MLKNTKKNFVFQDSSIPDVYGDICPCVCDHQTAYIAYWHLYWVKQIKQYCLKFHAQGQDWTGITQTRWQHPYNVLYVRIARLELITQSACVAYLLLLAKPWWWQVSLDDGVSSKIFKRGKFAQLTNMVWQWYKHDEVTFQLAADFDSEEFTQSEMTWVWAYILHKFTVVLPLWMTDCLPTRLIVVQMLIFNLIDSDGKCFECYIEQHVSGSCLA